MIDKTKRELGLVACSTCPAIRIIGPFIDDPLAKKANFAIMMAKEKPTKGYTWMHAHWGEITRAKDCIVEAPAEYTLTYQGIP